MFNPSRTVIEVFVAHTIERYQESFPNQGLGHEQVLEQAAYTALETLLSCDCPYHDLEHTLLVTDVGQTMLRGRLISQGDVTSEDWLHVVIAMLFHDIGYLRGLLREDAEDSLVTDFKGKRFVPPPGATDACMMPFHVDRSRIFMLERFAGAVEFDVERVSSYIEMTRFPVPADAHYRRTDTFPALVRAADLIGQMGDPRYSRKVSRLFTEFVETGEAARLGYSNADELRADFPEFFYQQVYPFITDGLRYLRRTQEGQQWVANLFHHVHELGGDQAARRMPELDPRPLPHIAVNNQ